MITLAELVPQGESFAFFVDEQTPNYQILKRDLKNNLALIKLEGTDFQTCGFADFEKTRLGERIFLIGTVPNSQVGIVPKGSKDGDNFSKLVNEGIIKFFNDKYIQTNIFEKYALSGSPLFNIEGELLGLNTIDSQGKVTAIPITKIRAFVGF